MQRIRMVIDDRTLEEYEKHYFSIHTRAKKKPIARIHKCLDDTEASSHERSETAVERLHRLVY